MQERTENVFVALPLKILDAICELVLIEADVITVTSRPDRTRPALSQQRPSQDNVKHVRFPQQLPNPN